MAAAVEVDRVWKKFHRGELHDSLRDMIPALARRLFAGPPPGDGLRDGDFWALADVSFRIEPGEALGVVGPNGAGKSTLLKILSRILRPNRGRYRVHGRLRALIEIAAGFHVDLTGRENIFLNGAILGMSRKQIERRLDEIVAFAGMAEAIDTPVKRYSSGMVARLGFAVAAHMDPEILLVDEVLSVGDVGFQTKCLARMKEIRATGAAMIFVSHDIPQVLQVCDRLLVLDRGKVAHLGDREQGARTYFNLAAGQANYGGAAPHEMGRVRVVVDGADGDAVREIEFGTPLELRIDYDFPHDLQALEVVLRILSPDGLPVIAPASGRQGLTLTGRRGSLRCFCPGLRLLPGTYKATAHLRDPASGRVLDHFLHQSPFVVKAPTDVASLPPTGYAAVDVDQEWARLV
jgi:ABC-type polysaccharide/polyol phosphate transport system ATPase subunit